MKGPFDEPAVSEEGAAVEEARPHGRKPTDKPACQSALNRDP